VKEVVSKKEWNKEGQKHKEGRKHKEERKHKEGRQRMTGRRNKEIELQAGKPHAVLDVRG
jgi:hypothetical protein